MSDPFAELPSELQRTIVERGFTELTPVQQAVIRADGARDLNISSQTGSGKTVAVGIAVARQVLAEGRREEHDLRPTVLALTPTRELAAQVQRELAWLLREIPDSRVEVVTGGTSVGAERGRLARGPRIIVGTPGRTLDHLNSGGFDGARVRLVILDEADHMLDMGFREELTGILDRVPDRQRTHLLSATFPPEVREIAEQYQSDAQRIEGSPLGDPNEDITHIVHVVDGRHRYAALVNVLLLATARQQGDEPVRTLVFVRTRADTIELTEKLQRDGVGAECLSGDLPQAQRTRTLAAFRAGRVSTLVATDVAARGLDVTGIQLVVHGDPPGDADTYTHRSGRTGRAGQKGTSVLLLPPQARWRIERLLHQANVNPSFAPVPTPERIAKEYRRRTRRRLFAALGTDADAEHLEYARKLLEDQSPETLVAALLGMVTEEPPCAPRRVTTSIHLEPKPSPRDRRNLRAPSGRGRGERLEATGSPLRQQRHRARSHRS